MIHHTPEVERHHVAWMERISPMYILLQKILREFREEAPKEVSEAAFEGGS
jgi:hypothetical protein